MNLNPKPLTDPYDSKSGPVISGGTLASDHAAAVAIRKAATRPHAVEGAGVGAAHGRVPPDAMAFLHGQADGMRGIIADVTGKALTSIPVVIVGVEVDDRRTLAHYKLGRDALGLPWRVNLNLLHLGRPTAEVLATLLHEMFHAAQHSFGEPGTPPHHNKEFQAWCDQAGIPTDSGGHYKPFKPGSPFTKYLSQIGIPWVKLAVASTKPGAKPAGLPGFIPPAFIPKPKGSTLKKWVCGCGTPIRSGRSDLNITCNECNERFQLVG